MGELTRWKQYKHEDEKQQTASVLALLARWGTTYTYSDYLQHKDEEHRRDRYIERHRENEN